MICKAIIEDARKLYREGNRDILAEYGVEAKLAHEDYLKGLKTVRKVW